MYLAWIIWNLYWTNYILSYCTWSIGQQRVDVSSHHNPWKWSTPSVIYATNHWRLMLIWLPSSYNSHILPTKEALAVMHISLDTQIYEQLSCSCFSDAFIFWITYKLHLDAMVLQPYSVWYLQPNIYFLRFKMYVILFFLNS